MGGEFEVEVETMPASKARVKANSKYNAKTYDALTIRCKKENRTRELVDIAWKGRANSKNEYMESAILAQLEKDGISIDMLPPLEEQDEEMEPNDSDQEEL